MGSKFIIKMLLVMNISLIIMFAGLMFICASYSDGIGVFCSGFMIILLLIILVIWSLNLAKWIKTNYEDEEIDKEEESLLYDLKAKKAKIVEDYMENYEHYSQLNRLPFNSKGRV